MKKAGNKKEYRAINRKGVEQYPEKFQMEFFWVRVSVLDTMAWVENEVEWIQKIDGKDVKQLTRNTILMKYMDSRWQIVHVHGSLPDYRLAGQNYIINSETVRYNQELEREVHQRTRDLNLAMENLKKTQSLLIQSEKMASLGELTAGIAHEIQNPLNFVNNFSEVNKELTLELEEELKKGNLADVQAIAKDIRDNEEKINHHGRRADAIVKNMLQHSRASTGTKEPTDINALADEYLRLAYHGLRARDKNFNAFLNANFDENVGHINVVPQDIGRVFLNLFNNAFYAVADKKKSDPAFELVVSVSTKKQDSFVLIIVSDNGSGIPPQILDKIFQPFFTTKPTGQGTGLGLSLSYDIVKAHGGELKVETVEGEGSTFIISLPQ